MAKISELEELAAQDIDGTEKLPVVKNGVARQAAISDLGTPAAVRAEAAADQAAAIVDETLSTSRKLKRNFTEVELRVGGRDPNGTFAAGNFSRWAVGAVPAAGAFVDSVSLFLTNLSAASKIRLQAWTRPLSVGDGANNTVPGLDAADAAIYDKTFERADIAGIDWNSAGQQEVKLALPASAFGTADGQTILFFAMSSFDDNDAWTPLGAGYTAGVSPEPDFIKGYYSANGNNLFTIASNDAGTNGVAFRIYSLELLFLDAESDPIGLSALAGSGLIAEQSDLTIETPPVTLRRPGGVLAIAGGSLALDGPAVDAIADEAIDVAFSASGILAPGRRLKYQFASGAVLTRSSDGAVLVAGVDYDIQENTGYLYGKVNTATFAATVDYSGHRSRYDLIYADATTGALGVAKGADRIVDPEHDAFQAALPSGKIALFKAYVYFDMSTGSNAAELIPVFDVRDLWKQSHVAALADRKRRNRNALPKLMRQLRRGARVDIAAMGDSRTHRRTGAFLYPAQAEQVIAGGKTRDHSAFYARQQSTFVDAGIPTFDDTDPDFAELLSKDGQTVIRPALPAGSAGYSKDGYLWHFRDALADYGGSEVNILNFGLGGTDSGPGTAGTGGLNGSEAALIDAVKAVGADLVSIAYGMNNGNTQDTYGEIRALIEAHQANGSEVIVWAVGQINSFSARRTQEQWAAINDQLERAAADTGAAFIPLHALMGSGFENAVGFSRKSMCAADLYVHQGIEEDRQTGRFGAGLVL